MLAWTMVNDRPDSPVTDASTYAMLASARANQDLVHVDDVGIAWAQDLRNELWMPATARSATRRPTDT